MKRFMGITVISVFAFLIVIGGCATQTSEKSGTDRNISAAVTMENVEDDIRLLLLEVSSTNSAMASMVNPLQQNLPNAYDSFAIGNDSLENASDRFIDRSNKMATEGNEYFTEWRKQGDNYENPKIRELSEQRRSELSAVYTNITVSSVGIEGDLEQYVANVKEIETYFANDLTPGGVSSIGPFVNQTVLDGAQLSTNLRQLLGSVEMVRTQLTSGNTKTFTQETGEIASVE